MNITMYEWYVDDVDLNHMDFREGQYNGREFEESLNSLLNLSYARIRRYPLNATIHGIDECTDYINSSCDGLLLFYDGGYFEFYTRDIKLLHATFTFCANSGFDQAQFIEEATNERTWMHF